MTALVSELLTLGRCIQLRTVPPANSLIWREVEQLYLSPASRAALLAALWAMAKTDADGSSDGELVAAYDAEADALDEAGSASVRAQALWYKTLPLEEVG
jgi:hypothetical protein